MLMTWKKKIPKGGPLKGRERKNDSHSHSQGYDHDHDQHHDHHDDKGQEETSSVAHPQRQHTLITLV